MQFFASISNYYYINCVLTTSLSLFDQLVFLTNFKKFTCNKHISMIPKEFEPPKKVIGRKSALKHVQVKGVGAF
jgi:hypothetical protein